MRANRPPGRKEPRRAIRLEPGVDLPDEVLTLALTHRSYAYEHGGLLTNERLEFLGDAVLGLSRGRAESD
jgi:ribonuclease III